MLRSLALALIWMTMVAGCAVRTGADPARAGGAREIPADAWPARDVGALAPLVEDLPRLTMGERQAVMMVEGSLAPGTIETSVRIVRAAAYGRGIIREVEYVDDPPAPGERSLRFISSWAIGQAAATGRRGGAGVGGRPPALAPRDAFLAALDDARDDGAAGVELRVAPPLAGEPRGYIIWLHSLGGDRFERPVIEALRRRGWAVVESDFPWLTWSRQLTFLGAGGEWSAPARDFAERFDQRLAEWAYANEAALAYLEEVDRHTPADRVCVAGFSAGAICGPTLAAALGERVEAVVLVGGGADILRISQTNGLTNAGVGFGALDPVEGGYQPRELRREEMDELSRQYLRISSLDPYSAAPAIRDVPTLMLHAALDSVVPARTGRLLYERLGKPERWTFWLGHSLLFWRLPSYAERIATWVDEVVPARKAREAPRTPPPPISDTMRP